MLTFLWIIATAHLVTGTQVCSPAGCIDGSSSSKLLASADGGTRLTPGTYTTLYDAKGSLNQSISRTSWSTTVGAPPVPVLFSKPSYLGSVSSEWGSAYVPDGWYTLLSPGQSVWGPIPDRSVFGDAAKNIGAFMLGSCSPPCTSNGVCTPTNKSATCVCAPGWTGDACDTCLKGHIGLTCQPCPSTCASCDDGVQGSGVCLGGNITTCNCLHGSCDSNGGCDCSAGYMTTGTGQACSVCLPGFFQDTRGNCIACSYGCTSCALIEGTEATATCTECDATMNLVTTIPATCQLKTNCGAGMYFDTAKGTCSACSPFCSSCTGPSTADCITCAFLRSRFNHTCLDYNSQGVCNTQYAGVGGTFIVNAEKQKCDSCPATCKECYIPDFLNNATFNPVCTSCQDGNVLFNGGCGPSCPDGWYASSGTCQRCDATCATCIGSDKYCIRCTTGVASNGTCIASCPPTTLNTNGTCVACHPDCATCSGPLATNCITCPPSRPVLNTGQCLPFCPPRTTYDPARKTCTPCPAGCQSCLEGCTTCMDNYVLSGSSCVAAKCTFAPGLGTCLSNLIDTPQHRNLGLLAILAVLLLLVPLGMWLIRRERRKTREATAEFAAKIDDEVVSRKLGRLSSQVLDRAFGRKETRESHGLKPLVLLLNDAHRQHSATPQTTRQAGTEDDYRLSDSSRGSPEPHLVASNTGQRVYSDQGMGNDAWTARTGWTKTSPSHVLTSQNTGFSSLQSSGYASHRLSLSHGITPSHTGLTNLSVQTGTSGYTYRSDMEMTEIPLSPSRPTHDHGTPALVRSSHLDDLWPAMGRDRRHAYN